MLERAILLKPYLTTYTNHLQNTNQENYISALAWNNIEIYREFLEPFNFGTEMASCANTPTIIPLYSTELTNEAQNNKKLSFYDKIYQVKPHNNNNLEISKYVDEATISIDTNPLDWWKLNKNRYPVLSKIARDYLAIPATSPSSERTFSEGRYVITDQRCSLDEHTIQACLCLKSWMCMQDSS
ncbi:uncharacterized protein LOC135930548 [Gordionus sp. m RMFG-2023]|uniref:uncharacterized protein LOC135930548 n=1 Tax=Gordionus sp. m RMFG-2023 TaxID=3053472 RepID=UPI0031FCDD13